MALILGTLDEPLVVSSDEDELDPLALAMRRKIMYRQSEPEPEPEPDEATEETPDPAPPAEVVKVSRGRAFCHGILRGFQHFLGIYPEVKDEDN